MYKCHNCGAAFEWPAYRKETIGMYGDAPAVIEFAECPECGSDEFEEAYKCTRCAEWFTRDELDGDDMCTECRGEEEYHD